MRNRPSTRSIYDAGSEDNKSVRSGRSDLTAQVNYTGFLDNIGTMKPSETMIEPPSATMRNMKPPLRRRGESKEPSLANESMNKIPDQSMKSFQDMELIKSIPNGMEPNKISFNEKGINSPITSIEAITAPPKQV